MRHITDDWYSLIIAGSIALGVGFALYKNIQVQEVNNLKSQTMDVCLLENDITMNIVDDDLNMEAIQIKNPREKIDRYTEQIARLCSGLDDYEKEILISEMKELQSE